MWQDDRTKALAIIEAEILRMVGTRVQERDKVSAPKLADCWMSWWLMSDLSSDRCDGTTD